jgi:hypothetical protein
MNNFGDLVEKVSGKKWQYFVAIYALECRCLGKMTLLLASDHDRCTAYMVF